MGFSFEKLRSLDANVMDAVKLSGPPRARIGPGDRWDRGALNVSDDWKQWRFETIFYTHYCNMILY